MSILQGKGLMTTFWLLGEEGSEEGETLKEEGEEEEVKEEQEVEQVKEVEEVVEEEEEDEEAHALVTYTVSDHDTERLMLNNRDQNGLDGGDEIKKQTKDTSLKEETREEESLRGKS